MGCHILHFQDRSPHDDILQLISRRKIKDLHVEASCLSVVMNWWYNLSLYWYSNRKTCPMVCQYILFRLTKACLMCVNDVSYVRLCPYVLLTVSNKCPSLILVGYRCDVICGVSVLHSLSRYRRIYIGLLGYLTNGKVQCF
jgi:hypothetical protein